MERIDMELLSATAGLHEIPQGAYNIRKNGESVGRSSTANIQIENNESKDGIVVKIKPNTKNESVHIPVILSKTGLTDLVKNDFVVGDNAEVLIVAGCGIHSSGKETTTHNGVHRFFIGKNAKVRYVEKHIGTGRGVGDRVLNPITEIEMGEGASFEMETVQLAGVSYSKRDTKAKLGKDSNLVITEKILTENDAKAETNFVADMVGENSKVHIISRAVAKDNSVQAFNSVLNGLNKCFGHTECDAIITDNGKCFARPEVNALHPESSLIHEAAIGKIAGEQIDKLLTLGLSEDEARAQILKGFLK